MIISVGEVINTKYELNIGTHDGPFNCSEVVAIAIIEMAHMEQNVNLVRTSNSKELGKVYILVDIGEKMFQNRMAEINVCKTTKEKYVTVGHAWRSLAEEIIKNIANEQGVAVDDNEIQFVKEQIDSEIINLIDLEEKEGTDVKHMFSFIDKFLPNWFEKADYNDAFSRVQIIVSDMLQAVIKNKIAQAVAKSEIKKRSDFAIDGILEIPVQTMPWLEEVVKYNESHDNKIKFVVFRCHAKGWEAQCVPQSIENKSSLLIPFPEEWAGGNEKTLPKLSGINDAIFCSNGCARARTKRSITEMCKIAMSL